MNRIGRIAAVGALVLTTTQMAVAQTPEERAGARAAAEMGVKAFNEGRWADTVDLMIRAEKLVHAPTHQLYQAQAEEKLGHLVAAHELYVKIAREKLAREAPEVFINAQAEAKTRAEALRSRLSQVTIIVEGAPPGAAVTVTRGDRRVPDALVGMPHPVDPGEHRFQATAEGMRSGTSKVVLREGGSETVVLKLEPSDAKPKASVASDPKTTPNTAQPTGSGTAGSAEDSATTQMPSGAHPLTIGGFVGLGVGVAGLAVGTLFAIRSSNLSEDADTAYALCVKTDGRCYAEERGPIDELDADADKSRTISTVGFIAGGVGVAAGVTMLILAPASTPTERKGAFVTPYFTGNSAGVWGRF